MATSDNCLIQVNNLQKHYDNGAIKALDGVSVEVDRGDVIVVLGSDDTVKSVQKL